MTDDRVEDRYCSTCGSYNLRYREGEFETGVVAPDGGREMQFERFVICLDCGAREEYEE